MRLSFLAWVSGMVTEVCDAGVLCKVKPVAGEQLDRHVQPGVKYSTSQMHIFEKNHDC